MTLLLKTIKANGTSCFDDRCFYPQVGETVVAEDWNDRDECGGGLHGLKDGCGDGSLMNWSTDALWVVLESDHDGIDLGGKFKVPDAIVRFRGERANAIAYLVQRGCDHQKIVGAVVCDDRAATAGDYGTATAGDKGQIGLYWWDHNRRRIFIGYIGEDGLKPNIKYCLNKDHKPVEVAS